MRHDIRQRRERGLRAWRSVSQDRRFRSSDGWARLSDATASSRKPDWEPGCSAIRSSPCCGSLAVLPASANAFQPETWCCPGASFDRSKRLPEALSERTSVRSELSNAGSCPIDQGDRASSSKSSAIFKILSRYRRGACDDPSQLLSAIRFHPDPWPGRPPPEQAAAPPCSPKNSCCPRNIR